MNKEQLAAMLNGNQMGSEISKEEAADAKAAGLVVVFGYSDDNLEFRGAIYDEVGVGEHSTILLHRSGLLANHEDRCECVFCGYMAAAKQCARINPIWDRGEYSWQYSTEIPHATFDIMEDDEKFCRGIVFDANSLPELAT